MLRTPHRLDQWRRGCADGSSEAQITNPRTLSLHGLHGRTDWSIGRKSQSFMLSSKRKPVTAQFAGVGHNLRYLRARGP